MRLKSLSDRSGMSLLEVVVALGIMSIMILAVSNSMIEQQNQIKYLEQKSDILDLKLRLNNFLENPNYCITTIKTNAVLDLTTVTQTASNEALVNYTNLQVGPPAGPLVLFNVGSKINSSINAPTAEKITLSHFLKTPNAGLYKALFKIDFARLNKGRVVAGVEKEIFVKVDDSHPNAAKILDCLNSSSSSSGPNSEQTFDLAACPAGMTLIDQFYPQKTCGMCTSCTTVGGWGLKANCSYTAAGSQGCGGSSAYWYTATCLAPTTPTRVKCK